MTTYRIETIPAGTNIYRESATTSPLTAQIIPAAGGSGWVAHIFRTAFNGTPYADLQYGATASGWVPTEFLSRMEAEVFARRVLGLLPA